MAEERDETPCYIGRCPECRSVLAASVDVPMPREDPKAHRKRTSQIIAEWVRDGLIIDRMSVSDVRTSFHLCDCAKKQREISRLMKQKLTQGALL